MGKPEKWRRKDVTAEKEEVVESRFSRPPRKKARLVKEFVRKPSPQPVGNGGESQPEETSKDVGSSQLLRPSDDEAAMECMADFEASTLRKTRVLDMVMRPTRMDTPPPLQVTKESTDLLSTFKTPHAITSLPETPTKPRSISLANPLPGNPIKTASKLFTEDSIQFLRRRNKDDCNPFLARPLISRESKTSTTTITTATTSVSPTRFVSQGTDSDTSVDTVDLSGIELSISKISCPQNDLSDLCFRCYFLEKLGIPQIERRIRKKVCAKRDHQDPTYHLDDNHPDRILHDQVSIVNSICKSIARLHQSNISLKSFKGPKFNTEDRAQSFISAFDKYATFKKVQPRLDKYRCVIQLLEMQFPTPSSVRRSLKCIV